MRVREFRKNVWRSLATAVRIKSRTQLVRYISEKLYRNGEQIPDELVHVTHYGYDDRIGWDDYIIVVEGYGVFGYADAPCPALAQDSAPEIDDAFLETKVAFVPAYRPKPQRRPPPAAMREAREHQPARVAAEKVRIG